MIPYAQKIVSDYLREEIGGRVVAKPPDDLHRIDSWIMFTLLSAVQDPDSVHDHLVEFYFQLDCYASRDGGLPEAWTTARTVREAVIEMPGTYDDAVVTATRISQFSPEADTDMEPARDRFIITASAWMHPALVAS